MVNSLSTKIYLTPLFYVKSANENLKDCKWYPRRNYSSYNKLIEVYKKRAAEILESQNSPAPSKLAAAATVFATNCFFNMPLEAFFKNEISEAKLRKLLLLIANFPHEASAIFRELIPFGKRCNNGKLFLSSSIANVFHYNLKTQVDKAVKVAETKGFSDVYSTYISLHRASDSLSFWQQMKIRILELSKCEYYCSIKRTGLDIEIEKIFIELFNIKTIDIEHECL